MARLTDPLFGPQLDRPLDPRYCFLVSLWQSSTVWARLNNDSAWGSGIHIYQVVNLGTAATLEVVNRPIWTLYRSDHTQQPLYGYFVIAGYTFGVGRNSSVNIGNWRQIAGIARKRSNDELELGFDDGAPSSGHEPDFNDLFAGFKIGQILANHGKAASEPQDGTSLAPYGLHLREGLQGEWPSA